MSGSGSSGGDWRPEAKPEPKPKAGAGDEGGGARPADPCNITETTNLNSVSRTAVAALRVGDRLNVVFQAGPPQRLVAQTQAGVVAGSITSPSMLQFIQCIQADNHYVAEVIAIRGALCQVRIQPR